MSGVALEGLGRRLGRLLSRPNPRHPSAVSGGLEVGWWKLIEPGDVLLVEGRTRIGTAIKYLTQSTWSHAALYVGDRCPQGPLVEADLLEGVIASPIEKYVDFNTRICRPTHLRDDELEQVLDFAIGRIGNQYDLRNVFDLARYLIPTPPVPVRWRRRLLTFGSGEPTKAICSGLIAQAFQQIRYPILPKSWWSSDNAEDRYICYQIRHFSTFTPRDFDLSPYFDVVKPTVRAGFDFRALKWVDDAPAPLGQNGSQSEPVDS